MIIKTKVVFTDEYQSSLLNKEINLEEDFEFDLSDVSGIMPGSDDNKKTIIFLTGTSLTITSPFTEIRDLWRVMKEKKYERIN